MRACCSAISSDIKLLFIQVATRPARAERHQGGGGGGGGGTASRCGSVSTVAMEFLPRYARDVRVAFASSITRQQGRGVQKVRRQSYASPDPPPPPLPSPRRANTRDICRRTPPSSPPSFQRRQNLRRNIQITDHGADTRAAPPAEGAPRGPAVPQGRHCNGKCQFRARRRVRSGPSGETGILSASFTSQEGGGERLR